MTFSARQVLTAAALNDLDITTITTSGNGDIGGTLSVSSQITATSLITTSSITANGSFEALGTGAVRGNFEVGQTNATSDKFLKVLSNDGYRSEIQAYGFGQGTGVVYVGQNETYGGGVFYNGDGTPAYATGEGADRVSFFRRNNGTNEVVFSYPYSNNTVEFRATPQVNGTAVSLSNHSHSYLPLSGGTLTGTLTSRDINVGTAYDISFGAQVRQMLNLWNTNYGVGVQSNTLYFRSGAAFSFHIGGSHNDAEGNPGGGNHHVKMNTAGVYLFNGWYRTYNQTGWYSETYNGGWYMIDATWVRSYQNKGIYTADTMECGYQFRIFKALGLTNGSWNYTQSHVRLDSNGSGALSLSGHPHGGFANMLVWSTGSSTIYFRDWNNTGYCGVEGFIYNASHSKYKTNITPLRPKSVGSAASRTLLGDTLKKIELVEYEYKDSGLVPDNWELEEIDGNGEKRRVPNERRQKAYARLNEIRKRRGLENYKREHICGKDCDHSPDEPCHTVRNARMRIPGFLAEQTVEHLPGVIALNEDGEGHSVNLLALSGFLMGVVQELVERVDQLETVQSAP